MKYNKKMYENDVLSLIGLYPHEQFFVFDMLMLTRQIAMEKGLNERTVKGKLVTQASFDLAAYTIIKHGDEINRETAIVISAFVLMGTADRALHAMRMKNNAKLNKLVRIWLYEVTHIVASLKTDNSPLKGRIEEYRTLPVIQNLLTPTVISKYEITEKQARTTIDQLVATNKAAMDFKPTLSEKGKEMLKEGVDATRTDG